MKQHTINLVCVIAAVAGVSFGIGTMVGQDRAEAGAKPSRIQFVRDTAVRSQLFRVAQHTYKLCQALPREPGTYGSGCTLP